MYKRNVYDDTVKHTAWTVLKENTLEYQPIN